MQNGGFHGLTEPFNSTIFGKMKRLFILALAAALAGGCKRGGESALTVIDKFGGPPYTGRVTVTIEAPGQPSAYHAGQASFQLSDSTHNVARLVLFGAIGDESEQAGDAGFILDGTYTDSGWSFRRDPMRFEIDGQGNIFGEMETDDERYTYSGIISPTEFSIKTVAERLTATPGGYPAGTMFRFEHSGQRVDPNAPPSTDGGDGSGCRNIRWELRNVWNPGGGAMSLVRVPVCYD